MDDDSCCDTRPPQSGKSSSIGLFIILAIIFVLIIVTCVHFVSILAANKDPDVKKTQISDRSYVTKSLRHVVKLVTEGPKIQRNNTVLAEQFPYVVAVTRNASRVWRFACFASVVLMKWIVTAAHCRLPGHTHRAILYHDYAYNRTHSFPILFWRLHEKYNKTLFTPRYDIAVAKLNIENYPYKLRPAVIDESMAMGIEASVWKTVATMDKQLYLTNQFDKYDVKIGHAGRCFESYGIEVDDALICVDTSDFDDCFTHDFGPVFSGDKLVGLLLVKPMDCDMKLSIFTNVSFYTKWILKTTRDS